MVCPSCGAQLPPEDLECPQCGANVGWWVRSRRGEESGPYTFHHMQGLVRQGRLGALDRVRIGLIGEWVSAPEVLRPGFQHPEAEPTAPVAARPRVRRSSCPTTVLMAGLAVVLLVGTVALVARRHWSKPRGEDPGQLCLGNLSKLARGLQLYAEDSGERFPPWQTWGSAAYPHVDEPGAFVCPAAPGEPGYAYNAALTGVTRGSVAHPDRCVMLWDAGALGPFAGVSGMTARHRGGDNYAFVDGHTAWRARGTYEQTQIELQP